MAGKEGEERVNEREKNRMKASERERVRERERGNKRQRERRGGREDTAVEEEEDKSYTLARLSTSPPSPLLPHPSPTSPNCGMHCFEY